MQNWIPRYMEIVDCTSNFPRNNFHFLCMRSLMELSTRASNLKSFETKPMLPTGIEKRFTERGSKSKITWFWGLWWSPWCNCWLGNPDGPWTTYSLATFCICWPPVADWPKPGTWVWWTVWTPPGGAWCVTWSWALWPDKLGWICDVGWSCPGSGTFCWLLR